MSPVPVLSDPEIAAATFSAHLDHTATSELGQRWGWAVTRVDPLEAIVHMHATREDGTVDEYHLRVRAHYYDEWPPQAVFVAPPTTEGEPWREPDITSRWLPNVQNIWADSRFAYHVRYPYPDGHSGQLICCSKSLDYYFSNHTPTEGQHWRQGKQTIVALLSRVQEALQPPAYQGPLGDLNT
jgi:hypothetical protein